MRILLLGGGGFIGSHLTKALIDKGCKVTVFDLYEEKVQDVVSDNLTFIQGDIRKCHDIIEYEIKNTDLVVDLIAYANPKLYVDKPLDVFELNFMENLKTCQLCVKYEKRLIQFSTCEVYGTTATSYFRDELKEPDADRLAVFDEDESPMIMGPTQKQRWIYACGKHMLERVLHAYGLEDRLDYTIVRPFNWIGPKIDYLPTETGEGTTRVFSNFMDAILYEKDIQLVDGGQQRRAFTYISDCIDALLRIIFDETSVSKRQIYNIGNPESELSVQEFAELMIDIYKENWWDQKKRLPEMITVSGEEFYGKGYEDCLRRIPKIDKIREHLGWEPKVDLRETVFKCMEAFIK